MRFISITSLANAGRLRPKARLRRGSSLRIRGIIFLDPEGFPEWIVDFARASVNRLGRGGQAA